MAQIVIPDEALIREPNLLVPGRKPVGPVRIDWSNPITRGLRICYMPADQHADLVSGKRKAYSVAGNEPRVYDGNRGVAPESSTGIDFIDLFSWSTSTTVLNITFFIDWRPIVWGDNYAYFVRLGESTSGRYIGVRSGATATNEVGFYAYVDTVPLAINVPFDGVDSATSELTDVKNSAFTYTRDASRNAEIKGYMNGAYTGVNNTGNGSTRSGSFGGIGIGANITDTNEVVLFAVYVWGRVLSDAELASLGVDPYQFLIPA